MSKRWMTMHPLIHLGKNQMYECVRIYQSGTARHEILVTRFTDTKDKSRSNGLSNKKLEGEKLWK